MKKNNEKDSTAKTKNVWKSLDEMFLKVFLALEPTIFWYMPLFLLPLVLPLLALPPPLSLLTPREHKL